jgi:poly [ADP-ribose] polymerase
MSYEPKYLLLVDNNNNGTQSNKYYKMIPNGDNFSVEYGRVGANPQKRTYPISQWNKKYSEKINKGYKDQSQLYEDLFTEEVSKNENPDYKEIENKVVREIVNKLQSLAKNTVTKNYKVSSDKVTQAMVDKAQELLDALVNFTGTVDEFNKALLELYTVIPRKMKDVNEYLVTKKEDFDKKIIEENDILTTMRSQVYVKSVHTDEKEEQKPIHDVTILDALGLEIEEATAKDIELIKNKMAESKHLFKRAWKVVNKKTQEKYDKFVKDNNITDTRLLFHGSRSENFWSILQTGLVLRPTNAVITGKMFGYGIYYAPKCKKSVGYTSLHGSYWARGGSNTAYMALFDVAYGTPYNVYNFDSKYYSLDYNKLQSFQKGANCLHAHSDRGMLQNDEIVVYKEEQMTIKYLIEIGD